MTCLHWLAWKFLNYWYSVSCKFIIILIILSNYGIPDINKYFINLYNLIANLESPYMWVILEFSFLSIYTFSSRVMAIVIFVPLVSLMAQVGETHVFTWRLFQACFKYWFSLLITMESFRVNFWWYPCFDVCLCHLSHKWHKYDNAHNSAREGAFA